MQTKRIKCPNCKVVLDVKNSKNEEVKQITCPNCKTTLQVKFPPQKAPLETETYYAPKKPTADSGATQSAGSSYGATQLVTPKAMTPIYSKKARILLGAKVTPQKLLSR